jgi:hypothetical protein
LGSGVYPPNAWDKADAKGFSAEGPLETTLFFAISTRF